MDQVKRERPLAEDRQKDRIRAEYIRLWLRSPWPMITTVVVSLIGLYMLWGAIPHLVLSLWAGCNAGWVALRYLAWRRYASKVRDDSDTLRWLRNSCSCFAIRSI